MGPRQRQSIIPRRTPALAKRKAPHAWWHEHGPRSAKGRERCRIAVGVGLEFVQLWSGRREFEVNDILADAVGASLGAVLGFSFGRWVGACVEQNAGRSVYANRR
jgi:hypothetical protein